MCAHAVARDKTKMLGAVEDALAAGATACQFRREKDFAPDVADPSLAAILARADIPAIPVDVDPYRAPVRNALDSLVGVLKELGGQVELRPPARLDTILDAERAAKLSLPNDYRAFLSITNGMRLLDCEFLATADYRDPTALAQRAHHFVHAEYAMNGLSDCVPLASWGTADDWLLYDPRGRVRGGAPGYIATLGKDEIDPRRFGRRADVARRVSRATSSARTSGAASPAESARAGTSRRRACSRSRA